MARDADDPEDDADDTPDYRLNISNHSADDKVLEPIITSESTLIDYLTEQINEHDLSEKQQQIADYIIGSIDDNGYLTRSVSAISDDLIFQEPTCLHGCRQIFHRVFKKTLRQDYGGYETR